MYDKTIAGEHRIYEIQIPSSPTLIYDLLTPQDKENYDSILTTGMLIQPLAFASINDDRQMARTPIDGYIVCQTHYLKIRTSQTGSDEIVPNNERYTFPVYFWPHKSLVSTDNGPATALIRVFFS